MVEINKSLDGTLEKAISASSYLKKMPSVVQDFMLLGDFKLGKAQKVTAQKLNITTGKTDDPAIQNLAAQLAGLDKSQQSAIFKMSDLSDAAQNATRSVLEQTAAQESLSGSLVESALKANGFSDAQAKEVIQNAQLVDSAGNYLVVSKNIAQQNLETALSQGNVSAALQATNQTEKQLAATIISTVLGQQAQTATTWAQKLALDALTITLSLAKQAAISFGIGLITWAASKAVDYLMNLKTHSEELVAAMNDSHDAAEQATKDVEEIQSKIDELNDSLEAAGVKKIEDIVDPAERERLQAINDMLQAQLELKKQLEKDANDKANADTSTVVNDKTEKSIYAFEERHDWTGDYTTGEDITKTESLQEHTTALNDLIDKRRELATAGKEDTQEYKDNEVAITSETEKVEELSSAVSEQMDGYETDADSFAKYKDEYVTGTNAMTAATKALANANDKVGESASNYDVLLKKMQAAKNDIDNGNAERRDYRYMGAVDSLKQSGVTTGDDLSDLVHNPSKRTKEQTTAINILREAAKKAGVDIDSYVQALEVSGEFASKTAKETTKLSDAMTTLDNMQSGYQTCASAVDEYNKKGYVTMDTLQSLINLEPKYLKMLELKDGQLKINTQTAQTLTDANIQLARASLLADTLNNIKDTNNLKKAQSILGSVTEVVENATGALIGAQHQAASEAFESEGFESYAAVMDATSTMISNYETLDALFVKLGKQNPSKIWGKDSSATNKASKQASSALDAWSTLSSAMEEYNKQGSISLNTMKSLMGLEEKYTACLKKQGNELTIDATKFRNMIQAELAVAAATEDASDKTKAKVAQYTQILQYLDENAKEGTISLNELRDAIEGVGASLDKAQEKTSGLKSTFDTIHDILNTDNPAGALTSDNVESVIDLIQEHSELKDILYDENGSLVINEKSLKAATIALLENEKAATKDVAIQAILQKSIDDLSNGIISITDYLKGLNTELDDIDSKLDKFQSGFNDIVGIVNEYNLYGKLNQDSLQKLLRLDPQYLACLEKEGNQLKFNAAQYRMLYAEQLNQLAITAKTKTQRDTYTTMLADIFGFTPDQLEQYKSAINEYSDAVQKFRDQGVDKYGNIDNLNRDIIKWTSENLEKYHDFVEEQNAINPGEIEEGGYSTVLGADENIDGIQIAFTPMLQTENGAVPLTEDQLWNYLDTIIEAAYGESDTLDIDKLLALDAEGLDENINGVVLRVKGMIAAIQGMMLNGEQLTAADVSAIAGQSEKELQSVYGMTSKYVGMSMHDVQAAVSETKDRTGELKDILNEMGIDGSKALQLLEDHFGDANTSAEKFKSILSDMKDLFSSFLDLIESANSKKDNNLKLWGEAMTEDIDKRIDALNKQKEALQDANDEEERAITLAKLKAELEKARTQRTVRKLTSNGYEWVADESAVKEAQDNLNDQQREWHQEDAEKAIDDQIDKLNELKDKYSEIISLIGTDWDDYNKKLKYASEIADMTFTEMEGRVDVFKGNVLASMQAANPISSIKAVISNIESLISTLEKVGDVWDKLEGGNGGGGLTGLQNKITNLFGKSGTDGNVQNIFQKGYNSLKNITSNFFGKSDGSGITGLFKNGLNTLVDGAKSLFNANNVNSLTTIFSNGLSEIGSLFSNTFKGFGKVFSSASGGTGIFSGIGKFFKGIGTALGIGGGAVALSSVPTMTAANTAGMTGLAGVMAKGAISAGAVGTGGAIAGGATLGGLSSIPVIGAIIAGATIGVGNAVNSFKRQKEIWSSNDSTGTKIVKSVGKILWDISPIGILVNSVKTIGGWVKKIFGIQDKKSQDSTDPTSANGKVNVGDIVINSPDKPASATKKAQQQTPQKKKWYESKFWFQNWSIMPWNWGKKATGSKYIEESAPYNVDEQGPELIVRKPESGRYTYLETGDGVVPADITSKLFEMGGNPDKWFNDQLSKHTALSNIQNHTVEGNISVGDIYIQNPVGDTDVLAKEIIRDLPIKLRQERGRR